MCCVAKGEDVCYVPYLTFAHAQTKQKTNNRQQNQKKVHYLKERPAGDRSGVTLTLRDAPVPYAAGMLSYASWFTIPPGKASHLIGNRCCYRGFEPLNTFAVRVHTHTLGRAVFMTRPRANGTGVCFCLFVCWCVLLVAAAAVFSACVVAARVVAAARAWCCCIVQQPESEPPQRHVAALSTTTLSPATPPPPTPTPTPLKKTLTLLKPPSLSLTPLQTPPQHHPPLTQRLTAGLDRVAVGDPQLPQGFYPVTPTRIFPGERLAVTCDFDSRAVSHAVSAGMTHEKEMCNMYLMVRRCGVVCCVPVCVVCVFWECCSVLCVDVFFKAQLTNTTDNKKPTTNTNTQNHLNKTGVVQHPAPGDVRRRQHDRRRQQPRAAALEGGAAARPLPALGAAARHRGVGQGACFGDSCVR